MKNITAYFETFHPITNEWIGTATFQAARRAGLVQDLTYPMYAPVSVARDGWAYKAKR